jgi:hypothetical protein
MRYTYEPDEPDLYPNPVRLRGDTGADDYADWWVLGWHTEPDEDTDWTGYEVRTGQLVVVPLNELGYDDAQHWLVDPDEVLLVELPHSHPAWW